MRFVFHEIAERFANGFAGPFYRNIGQKLYVLGTRVQGPNASEDRLVPSLRRVPFESHTPQLEQADFVAPNAVVLGNVSVGSKASIWYGATILGLLPVRIGDNSILQDRVHVSRETTIGNHVFVGPNVTLQGSTLQNRAFVGMGATVRHATVSRDAVVAAGAVVPDNVTVPSDEVWAGNPAQCIRKVSPVEKQILREHVEETQALARIHEQQTSKSFRELLIQKLPVEDEIESFMRDTIERYDLTIDPNEEEFIEQRIWMNEKSKVTPETQDYDPYEVDMGDFPDSFHVGTSSKKFEKVRMQREKTGFSDKQPWKTAF